MASKTTESEKAKDELIRNAEQSTEYKEPSLQEKVQITREQMGFANNNLNTVEIYTKFEVITDSGMKLDYGVIIQGVWRKLKICLL